MTGYGQAAAENDQIRVTVTLRSVNHRFLDLNLRLRDDHRTLETTLRERAGTVLFRGRVDAQVDIESLVELPVDMVVNERLLAGVQDLANQLANTTSAPLALADLLRVPDLIRYRAHELTWRDEDDRTACEAFDSAVEQLVESRLVEGKKLAAILADHVDAIEQLTASLAGLAADWPQGAAEALERRIAELLGEATPDPARLAQEVAILVDRSDVREEIDRLRAHIEHFRTLMASPEAVGKRLDFLAQEVLRELNTTGAKCRDAEMTRWVLEGKARCEQIREQVQNVE